MTIGFEIHVGHINHHLRRGADTDQRFVERFCLSHNLPCTTQHIDLKKKIQQGGSVEEIAREERFKALRAIAKKARCTSIALAHHQNDLAETVLLRILRGTGLQGLQAILTKRLINKTMFIRPMLDVNRDDIETYLKKNKISFRTDSTNNQTRFFRNQIRLDLLPYLQKNYQSNINEILCTLATTAGEDYEYLRSETKKIFPKIAKHHLQTKSITLNLVKLKELPSAIRRMTLRLAIESVKGHTLAITFKHLNDIDDLMTNRPTNSIVDLPHQTQIVKTPKALLIS